MNGLCSHERLELALAGTLSADEESTLHLHLEDCELCAAEMERLSGGEQASREIAALLVPDELDNALPLREECSTADFVVDHLEPSDDPAVLGRLGGYDVLDIIGRGGMGVVLKGFDRELKRFVAIKALASHLAHSPLARKRFAREAQAAAAVVNLHVIAIHQVQPNGQLPFLVMPLLTGESLAQRIKTRGTLELKEILRIGMQAAEGLSAAHGQGLIHRDVKPANILLEKGVERAVLTDFGLARAADDVSMTRQGVVAGTPEYMSPEQARGEALDGRSDLFSLGCVLYEMATGVSPFRTDSTMATLRRIVDEQPVAMASLVPELPPWFSHIVERLLSKDPAQRFASASEVSHLLEQCLSHLQQPTSVPLPASLVPRAKGRRSMFISSRKGVIAMLGTIGMTLLGLVLMSASEPPLIADQWVGEDWGVVVLKSNKPGEYEGSFTGVVPDKAGTMQLKWSWLEKRFNGTWQEGDHRRGKISIRVVDGEIHGAWTTTKSERPKVVPQLPEIKSEDSQPGTTRLGDLLWERPATTRGEVHVFGDEVLRARLRQPGGIPDSEMPRVLLISTAAPASDGERMALMIVHAGDRHFAFANGGKLQIGNHAVTIRFIGQDSVIVESNGRWKRWKVAEAFADAVVLGPKLPVPVNIHWRNSMTIVDGGGVLRSIYDGATPLKGVADESLEGVWEFVSPSAFATEGPEDRRRRLVIACNWFAMFEGSQRFSASRIKVEPQHTPKRISSVDIGVGWTNTHGIYEVDGDSLRLSLAPDAEARPTKFGPERLKRVKGKLADEQLNALRQYAKKAGSIPGFNPTTLDQIPSIADGSNSVVIFYFPTVAGNLTPSPVEGHGAALLATRVLDLLNWSEPVTSHPKAEQFANYGRTLAGPHLVVRFQSRYGFHVAPDREISIAEMVVGLDRAGRATGSLFVMDSVDSGVTEYRNLKPVQLTAPVDENAANQPSALDNDQLRELLQFQGEWSVISREEDGEITLEIDRRLVIYGASWRETCQGEADRVGKLTVTAPGFMLSGLNSNEPDKSFGIYEISGDTLKYSLSGAIKEQFHSAAHGGDPAAEGHRKWTPDDFKTEGKPGKVTFTLKRIGKITEQLAALKEYASKAGASDASAPTPHWRKYGVTPAPVSELTAKVLESIGLHLTPITKDDFREENVFAKYAGGLDVTFVRSGGPAEKAGVHEVDIVVKLQGRLLASLADLDLAMQDAAEQIKRKDADSLQFDVLRNGETVRVNVPFPDLAVAMGESVNDNVAITVVVLRFADAKSALAALKDEAARRKLRGFEATIDARLNSITITAADVSLTALEEILGRLDTPVGTSKTESSALSTLAGVWIAEKVTSSDEVVPKEKFPFELYFEKDKLIYRFVPPGTGKDRVHEIVVDETKTPATIDIRSTDPRRKATVFAIFKLEGDRLWIHSFRDSNGQPSEKRPTTFDSSKEERSDLLVLTRKPVPQK